MQPYIVSIEFGLHSKFVSKSEAAQWSGEYFKITMGDQLYAEIHDAYKSYLYLLQVIKFQWLKTLEQPWYVLNMKK